MLPHIPQHRWHQCLSQLVQGWLVDRYIVSLDGQSVINYLGVELDRYMVKEFDGCLVS